jgi:hypothetical protein
MALWLGALQFRPAATQRDPGVTKEPLEFLRSL